MRLPLPLPWWKRISRLICSKGYLDRSHVFCITCTAKQKQENISPPPKLISALLFIITTTNILHLCDHNSLLSEHNTTLMSFCLLVWNENKISWWFQETFRVLFYSPLCSKYCIEEHYPEKKMPIIGSLHKAPDYCLLTTEYFHRFTTARVEQDK